ncbi:MAG TPA: ornithine cyclodeaminase family protein [Actinomycetota bacterium]|nr:ornithine cyclodeaminase family protein [Actinomycetota bacterium]
MIRSIGAEELRRALPMRSAIDALHAAFAAEDPDAAGPIRTATATPAGSMLLMPAAGDRGVGVKLVTISEGNPAVGAPLIQAAYVLFDAITQTPEAVLDGTELTALRTAAVSGLATRLLANPEAHRLVLFGAGVQAAAHLDAMVAVRPVDEVVIVSRRPERAQALAAATQARGIRAVVGAPEAVEEAHLVCTCTTSATPVFDGGRLAEGAHVNAIGAYLPQTREVDTRTIARARLVVETRTVAMEEAGDVLLPIAEGAIGPEHVVADLAELARGRAVRTAPGDVTVFVSVGMAFEDLVVARAVLEALG